MDVSSLNLAAPPGAAFSLTRMLFTGHRGNAASSQRLWRQNPRTGGRATAYPSDGAGESYARHRHGDAYPRQSELDGRHAVSGPASGRDHSRAGLHRFPALTSRPDLIGVHGDHADARIAAPCHRSHKPHSHRTPRNRRRERRVCHRLSSSCVVIVPALLLTPVRLGGLLVLGAAPGDDDPRLRGRRLPVA